MSDPLATVSGDVMPRTEIPVGPMPATQFTSTSEPEMVDIFTTDSTVPFKIPGTTFTVLLQKELDWGEQLELEAAALRGLERKDLETAANQGQTLILDISKQRILSLALRVRRWNVRRENPTTRQWEAVPLPASLPDRILVMKRLRPKWARAIAAKIEELDKESADAEPAMPALIAPQDEEEPPKVTPNGVTEGQLVT